MGQSELDAKTLAAAMDAELRALPVQNTPTRAPSAANIRRCSKRAGRATRRVL